MLQNILQVGRETSACFKKNKITTTEIVENADIGTSSGYLMQSLDIEYTHLTTSTTIRQPLQSFDNQCNHLTTSAIIRQVVKSFDNWCNDFISGAIIWHRMQSFDILRNNWQLVQTFDVVQSFNICCNRLTNGVVVWHMVAVSSAGTSS